MNIKTVLPKEAQERINSIEQMILDIENDYAIRIKKARTNYEVCEIRNQYQSDVRIKELREEICNIHLTNPYMVLVSKTQLSHNSHSNHAILVS